MALLPKKNQGQWVSGGLVWEYNLKYCSPGGAAFVSNCRLACMNVTLLKFEASIR